MFPISPVGHSVHLKNSCSLAYQTYPAPVISKSRVTLNSSNGSFWKGCGATKHTQSCRKKNVRYIRHDIGLLAQRGLDMFFSVRQLRRTKIQSIFQQNALTFLGFEHLPTCRCKSGYICYSATGAVYVKKKIMYIYPINMISDIGYDIRHDIIDDIIMI